MLKYIVKYTVYKEPFFFFFYFGPGGVARALRCSQFHGEGSAAAPGGKQAEQQGKRQHHKQAEEPPAPAGGGCTERMPRGGREGGAHEERAQDAAGCELALCPRYTDLGSPKC